MTVHYYRPGARTGDALAPCLDCGASPTAAGFAETHEPSRYRPRVYQSGGQVRLSCHRGHYLGAISRREWAGSALEALAGRPTVCRECV